MFEVFNTDIKKQFILNFLFPVCFILCVIVYVFAQPLYHEQDATQDQFLSRVQLVWI